MGDLQIFKILLNEVLLSKIGFQISTLFNNLFQKSPKNNRKFVKYNIFICYFSRVFGNL